MQKKKSGCVICGIQVALNTDQTCGCAECKQEAHNKFHSIIQETQGTIEGKVFI